MRWIVALTLAACTGVQQRFPLDVQTALAHQPMRRLETERFIIYYPADRRAEVDRFLARANRCADTIRSHAQLPFDDKLVIAMPDVAFNNAFVLPELEGYEPISMIPLYATLDFATEFGLPPDPGLVACHELVHYVHQHQIDGIWRTVNAAFGNIYTPQVGYDPWFWEGLAVHYESTLSPGVGRARWPIFTGMFAAAYAGQHVGSGELSSLNRLAHVGNHYLVGTMFVRFVTERYGERAMWSAIAANASAWTGWFFAGTLRTGTGVPWSRLVDEFDAWCKQTFPVRAVPASQHQLAVIGNDARYARGRDGTEAWVADDVDVPSHLVVRDASGHVLDDISLVGVLPGRTLVQAEPLLVSGLSITNAGDVWLTVIDENATFQVPRLLRWRRGSGLSEIATNLGPGATIDPTGRIYYYCWVDGDRWSLAAWEPGRAPRMILDMQPGTYVLTAQISPDGTQLAASVWDGSAFVVWVIEASTGRILRRLPGTSYDPSFTSDGHLMWLGDVDGRFQVFLDSVQATDAPYSILNAREAGGTIRFLDREHWNWELAEVGLRATGYGLRPDSNPLAEARSPKPEAPISDQPFSLLDHLFYPQEHAFTLLVEPHDFVAGAVVAGGDRLGLQRWSVAGYMQDRDHFGGDVAYLNNLLAPVQLLVDASAIDWREHVDGTLHQERRTRDVELSAIHTYRETLTSALSAIYTDDFTRLEDDPAVPLHIGGPQLAFGWVSGDSTRYTGLRRALLATAAVAYYPHAFSTFASDITDVGGSLGTVLPLPFGRRHTLRATVRGRALVSPVDTGLLQVGGDTGLLELWNGSSLSTAPPTFDTSRFAPNLRFVEPLRGYEDFAITTDRAALADLAWRYPIIIDRGVAATFNVLPASFIRELDVELFGAGALDRAGDRHLAAGGALTARIQILRLPILVTYQLARRFADDRALTQLVGVAPDL